MLQSGVMTRDLDVQWVSSLSWYFLNLMGLQSVFGFLLGSDNGRLSPETRPHLFGLIADHFTQLPTRWPSKWAWLTPPL